MDQVPQSELDANRQQRSPSRGPRLPYRAMGAASATMCSRLLPDLGKYQLWNSAASDRQKAASWTNRTLALTS